MGIPANVDAFTINGWGGSANPEFFRITSSGNVGIGTTSPSSKLDVQGGNAQIYNTGNASSVTVGSTLSGKSLLVMGTSADATGYGVIQAISSFGNSYGDLILNQSGVKSASAR